MFPPGATLQVLHALNVPTNLVILHICARNVQYYFASLVPATPPDLWLLTGGPTRPYGITSEGGRSSIPVTYRYHSAKWSGTTTDWGCPTQTPASPVITNYHRLETQQATSVSYWKKKHLQSPSYKGGPKRWGGGGGARAESWLPLPPLFWYPHELLNSSGQPLPAFRIVCGRHGSPLVNDKI